MFLKNKVKIRNRLFCCVFLVKKIRSLFIIIELEEDFMNEKISDQKIVRHYLDRLESAILETKNKYGKLINLIAYNILCSKDDADECENDTYLNVWNSIPPKHIV